MTDLLTRLEQATEGSRELDAAIARACGYSKTVSDGVQEFPVDPLPYTTSLDAALTLVPEGYAWSVESEDDGLVSNIRPAAIVRPKSEKAEEVLYFSLTPALALCIAALRARG